jgi:two-component system chemotaxis response regulator CheB
MVKIFVIDDSSLVRGYFRKLINETDGLELLGEAENPIDALEVFQKTGLPDMFILDIEMPKMDGLSFLKEVTKQKQIPTIICSSLVQKGSSAAIDALRYGAVDIVLKPSSHSVDYNIDMVTRIKAIAKSKLNVKFDFKKDIISHKPLKHIIGIASSTGGVQVLDEIIKHLQPSHPPILIVQHMPEGFTNSLAKRLDENYPFTNVKEAVEGDVLLRGRIIIAKSGVHMKIVKDGFKYRVSYSNIPKVDYHKPSGTVLFKSMAEEAKSSSVGIVLTGMGTDGAAGLKSIKEAGGKTYAQDESSSVVYGMPKQAVSIGAVDRSCSIEQIIDIINLY